LLLQSLIILKKLLLLITIIISIYVKREILIHHISLYFSPTINLSHEPPLAPTPLENPRDPPPQWYGKSLPDSTTIVF
jgi:hypothetical protein